MRPHVSVVIPVRNAADLVGATLESLRSQTHEGWEAVVVDDGSTDETAAVVEGVARLDDRVRLVRQAGSGVSAARNRGLRESRFDWVLFLDGDDLLTPRFLEKVADTLVAHPRADAANTGWARLLPDGRLFDEVGAEVFEDLFETTSRYCPFAIHTCIVRRDLVLEVGGFDEDLRVCEDWDLWGRLARTGLRVVPVWDAVAVYRVRGDSATFDGARTLRDGLRALDRIHGPDPRVGRPQPRYANGIPRAHLTEALIELAVWSAGLMIGRELDATEILDELPDPQWPALDPARVASSFFASERIGAMGEPLWTRWSRAAKLFGPFFAHLEELTGASGLATRVELRLARLAADECRAATPVTLGSLLTMCVEVEEPLRDLRVAASVDRVRLRVEVGGVLAGHAEAAVQGDVLTRDDLAELVLRQVAAGVLDAALLRELPSRRHRTTASQLAVALWGHDPRPFHRGPTPTTAPSRRVEGQRIAVDLVFPLGDLTVGPGAGKDERVEIEVALAGIRVVTLLVAPLRGRISGEQVRATALRVAPLELARATVAAGILGRPSATGAARRARLRDAATGASGATARSRSRVRRIRVRLVDDRWLARQAVIPEVEARLRSAARRLPAASRRRAKRLHGAAAAWAGPLAPFVPDAGARGIPVLMYHRVAPTGGTAARRWRVTPAELDDQLQSLRRAGYTGVSLEQLRAAWYEGERLPRRPVVLTFDDGFADFAEHAWPRVRGLGWGATVFVVADAVGGRNAWDDVYDDRVELMAWSTIRRLSAEGVDVGSHSLDHAALTALAPGDARRQIERSRRRIAEETGAVVRSFAYPFGDVDDAVAALVGDAGYDFGVTCEPGPVTPRADPLLLPRFEVVGAMTGRTLLGELGRLRG